MECLSVNLYLLMVNIYLSQMEIDVARKLFRMQIHVERVIGIVRQKFTILKSTLLINMIMSEDSEISRLLLLLVCYVIIVFL